MTSECICRTSGYVRCGYIKGDSCYGKDLTNSICLPKCTNEAAGTNGCFCANSNK